jgi:hypothetical protein
MSAGYSLTPLAQKLSLKDGMRVWRSRMPQSVSEAIARENPRLELLESPQAPIDAAHIFVKREAELELELKALLPLLDPKGFIWVSWPKKSSKVQTDISENTIRGLALPMGLVDVKVCAIDSVWSGLKLVIRKEYRSG